MATERELMEALRRADAAGDTQAAQAIARRLIEVRGAPSNGPVSGSSAARRQFTPGDPAKKVYDPTTGMTTGEKLRAGIGSTLAGGGLALKQLGAYAADAIVPGAGRVDAVKAEVDEKRRLDAPLMETGAGGAGAVLGHVATVLGPGALAKSAGAPAMIQRAFMPMTPAGNVVQGAAYGALQPIGSEDSEWTRLQNAGLGAGGGYVGSKIGEGFSNLARPSAPIIPPQRAQAVAQAREAGYVLPPTEIRPSMLNSVVEGVSGKIKTSQAASTRNQQVTNALAKRALGLPDDAPLTRETLQSIRQQAGQAYDAISGVGTLTADSAYKSALNAIASKYERAGNAFPKAVKSQVTELTKSLDEPAFDAAGAVDMIRILREQADTAFRKGETGMGKAAKDASKALEDLVERNLQRMKQPDLLNAYRDARQTIAKTYTVERALNDQTGDVAASALAALLKKGKPLSGDLKKIAEVGQAFPKATQTLPQSYNAVSPFDYMTGLGGTAVTGNPLMLATIAGRPAMRSLALSAPFQAAATKKALEGRTVVPRLLPFEHSNARRVLRRHGAIAGAGAGYGLLGD